MKIALLHISDLHVVDRNSLNMVHIKKIAATLNSIPQIDHLIIIISGDIAFSGKNNQYAFASYIIGHLIKSIRESRKDLFPYRVFCVPGNHDTDHKGKPISSKDLQVIRNNGQYSDYVSIELAKQTSFFNFSKRNRCFVNKDVIDKQIMELEDCCIVINLINSGVFSILEEDKGLHFIPENDINTIASPSEADYVFTVMHHSPDWYTDEVKNRLEEAVYSKSSILFLGHEHYIARKGIKYESNRQTIIQAGGCLCNNDDWSMSAFHLGVLNTETREYNHIEYQWNSKERQYEPSAKGTDNLPEKKSKFILDESFKENLLRDFHHELSSDFRDYFVFPRIRTDESVNGTNLEFTDEQSFLKEILPKKNVLITGADNSGKTSLMKKLFLSLYEDGYAPVLCSSETISGRSVLRIIKRSFEDCYGDAPADYTRFQQLPIEKRILIIDDFEFVKPNSLDVLLTQTKDFFSCIIYTSRQLIDVSLFDRMKEQLKTADSFNRYSIAPLFADKRRELIEKVVAVKAEDNQNNPRIAGRLAEAVTAQRHLIPLEPDFIIKYVECYYNNVGDVSDADSSVFSKVFEANLTNAISARLTRKLTVDKVYVLLSKIAYYIHFQKKYPIHRQDILDIVTQYNENYGASVDAFEFLVVVTEARILFADGESTLYRFANNSQLAYFVARAVNSQYHQTGDKSDLKQILRFACFGINSDILLFLSYITDNTSILRLILSAANESTKSWDEFDFSNNLPEFLQNQRSFLVTIPSNSAVSEEEKTAVEVEKEADAAIRTIDIYDYREEDAEQFVNQFIRGAQLLTIVARCLPSFEHILLKEDKQRFVEAIYALPNRLFYRWADEANKEVAEIIEYFRQQSQDYYAREKKISDEELVLALQWSAMSLLLDLYHLPVFYATKENTISYLSSFDYSTHETYALEHLMMLERQASSKSFIEEAIRLNEGAKASSKLLYSTMVKRVVRHALVFRTDLDHTQIQMLQSKFFPGARIEKDVLLRRLKNKENDVE